MAEVPFRRVASKHATQQLMVLDDGSPVSPLVVVPRHHLDHVVAHDHGEGRVNGGRHIRAAEVNGHQGEVVHSEDTLGWRGWGVQSSTEAQGEGMRDTAHFREWLFLMHLTHCGRSQSDLRDSMSTRERCCSTVKCSTVGILTEPLATPWKVTSLASTMKLP